MTIPLENDGYTTFCCVLGAIVSFLLFLVGLIHGGIHFYDGVLRPTFIKLAERMKAQKNEVEIDG